MCVYNRNLQLYIMDTIKNKAISQTYRPKMLAAAVAASTIRFVLKHLILRRDHTHTRIARLGQQSVTEHTHTHTQTQTPKVFIHFS